MVNQTFHDTQGGPFYLLFYMVGRDCGSFKIFPHDIQTGGYIGFFPTMLNFI